MEDCLQMTHFHMGSQIIEHPQGEGSADEAARVYVELYRLGAGLKIIDVGGGLGVDYDGSQTDFESSINYTLQEYANDVVFRIKQVCDEAGVPHPTIISANRAGRWWRTIACSSSTCSARTTSTATNAPD